MSVPLAVTPAYAILTSSHPLLLWHLCGTTVSHIEGADPAESEAKQKNPGFGRGSSLALLAIGLLELAGQCAITKEKQGVNS